MKSIKVEQSSEQWIFRKIRISYGGIEVNTAEREEVDKWFSMYDGILCVSILRQVLVACDSCQNDKISKSNQGLMNQVLVDREGILVCLVLMAPLPASKAGVTQLLLI